MDNLKDRLRRHAADHREAKWYTSSDPDLYDEAADFVDAAPAWHDRPTVLGDWFVPGLGRVRIDARDIRQLWHSGRVYGPIPPDTEAK